MTSPMPCGANVTPKSKAVLAFLKKEFPEARCALSFHNDFECLVAIVLSAQTSDKAVNKVTPLLFARYKDAEAFMEAKHAEIEGIISSLGLFRAKARNLIALGRRLSQLGAIPATRDELVTLPGVGQKTAGVFLLERRGAPYIPVDTHIARIAFRLGYAKKKSENPMEIERILERSFVKEECAFLHHALIAFGREICHAKNPACDGCGLKEFCRHFKKRSSTVAK